MDTEHKKTPEESTSSSSSSSSLLVFWDSPSRSKCFVCACRTDSNSNIIVTSRSEEHDHFPPCGKENDLLNSNCAVNKQPGLWDEASQPQLLGLDEAELLLSVSESVSSPPLPAPAALVWPGASSPLISAGTLWRREAGCKLTNLAQIVP